MPAAPVTFGMCPATLLVDPMAAPPEEVAAACRAAADSGFTEASVWAFQLDGLTGTPLRATVLEAATAWAGDDPAARAAEVEHFARLAGEHGSPLVAAVTMAPTITDVAAARDHLGALAARMEPLGARVCVEFFAWSAIDNLTSAWDLIEPLPSVGLVVDTFHWVRQRGGPDIDTLRSIPGDRIMYVQLADADREPSGPSEAEAMTSRRLPGEGVVDFASLFEVFTEQRADPFFATEVFNPTLVTERGAFGAATAMRDAAAQVLPPGIA